MPFLSGTITDNFNNAVGTQPGEYTFRVTGSATNTPANNTDYSVITVTLDAKNHIQTAYAASGLSYTRHCTAGSWSAWKRTDRDFLDSGLMLGVNSILYAGSFDGSNTTFNFTNFENGAYLIGATCLYSTWAYFFVGVLLLYNNSSKLIRIAGEGVNLTVDSKILKTNYPLSSLKMIKIGYWN